MIYKWTGRYDSFIINSSNNSITVFSLLPTEEDTFWNEYTRGGKREDDDMQQSPQPDSYQEIVVTWDDNSIQIIQFLMQ